MSLASTDTRRSTAVPLRMRGSLFGGSGSAILFAQVLECHQRKPRTRFMSWISNLTRGAMPNNVTGG